MTKNNQQDVIGFLSAAEAFSDGSEKIDLIRTHAAIVFLGKREVYKIKQAVKYPYLDQSTLAQRKALCESELRINKFTAPSIYVDVAAITRELDGELQINGNGEPIEWTVHMLRFPEADLLSNIASRGGLKSQVCSKLGSSIAAYHKGLKSIPADDGAQRIREIVDELTSAFLGFRQNLPEPLRSDFKSLIEHQFHVSISFLNARGRLGFVRRCHGDLHLRNIVMLDGEPTPFDALEFDERLAITDILYDLAFLITDVLHKGLTKEANIIFNRYLLTSWGLAQHSGLRLMPLFLALRAAIRAMVSLQTADRDSLQAVAMHESAETYLKAAIDYLHTDKPTLTAVGGLSGTGKSTLAAELAPLAGVAPGAVLLRSDLERKAMFNTDEFDQLPKEAYNRDVTTQVYARLMEKAHYALDEGYSVVLDAVFLRPEERKAASLVAKHNGVDFCGLWLDASDDILIERVTSRIDDASDADAQIVKFQLSRKQECLDGLVEGWRWVDASGSPKDTLQNAQTELSRTF